MEDQVDEEGIALNGLGHSDATKIAGQSFIIARGVVATDSTICLDDLRDGDGDGEVCGEGEATFMTANEYGQPTGGRRTSLGTLDTLGTGGRRISLQSRGGIVFLQNVADESEKQLFQEAITLPQSTHTLLITEHLCSVAFGAAFSLLGISVACLVLALWDNLDGQTSLQPLNVPPNVTGQVRAAQYLSIIIAVLMEEEIPTGLYLLRMIPKSSVESKLKRPYWRFVVSAMCRLLIGYLFLFNIFLVVVQSERVLDMFYDMLALSFVSMLDDIVFKLAQLDILGKRMRMAASNPCFATEFERRPYVFRKKMTISVKIIFILNYLLLLAGLTTVALMQRNGDFLCGSIDVNFGDAVWEHAWVETTPGEHEQRALVYSNFNGVYKKENSTIGGRPFYTEMRKSDHTQHFKNRPGAMIKYCEREQIWVFTHENIRKRKMSETGLSEDESCPWLLRSPKTDAFDLLDVDGDWEIWLGVIESGADVTVTCNECESNADCNYNGVCNQEHRNCICTDPNYMGLHCELERPCHTIAGNSDTNAGVNVWTVPFTKDCKPLHEYGRPVYYLDMTMNDLGLPIEIDENDRLMLLYSGGRWLANKVDESISKDAMKAKIKDFHAFWAETFKMDTKTVLVSDPTTASAPVGVDFYEIGEMGENYGPYGVLYPLAEPAGSGFFQCVNDSATKTKIERCKNETLAKGDIADENTTAAFGEIADAFAKHMFSEAKNGSNWFGG